jgi:hypothetical protein
MKKKSESQQFIAICKVTKIFFRRRHISIHMSVLQEILKGIFALAVISYHVKNEEIIVWNNRNWGFKLIIIRGLELWLKW